MKNLVVRYKSRILGKEIRETITVNDKSILSIKLDVLRKYLSSICPYVNYELLEQSILSLQDNTVDSYQIGLLCRALKRLIDNEIEFMNEHVGVDKIQFNIEVEDDHYIQQFYLSDSDDEN